MKLVWQRTTYSDGRQEYPAVYVHWDGVTAYLGRPHEGDPDQNERLVQGLLESGAPDWVQDAPGWIDEHGWGLYRAGRARLPYQVIEDNGGSLHLAVFSDDECIYYASGYEHSPDSLREDIAALRDGGHPIRDGWESDLPDSYTAQQLYDELTSYEYGWAVVADDEGIYYDRMGAAATTALAIPWQDLALFNADNQDITDPDEIRRALAEFRERESISGYFFHRIGAPHEDPEDPSTWGPQSPEHVDWTDF